jgi:putative transposase
VACHITQRGVDRCETFSSDEDRSTYLQLFAQYMGGAQVRLLGWCLMSNHVHLIAVPARKDSLSVLLRRVHGRYAQYYNARMGRSGHLWQNRFFACVLSPDHLWMALAYVERNPVRAEMVAQAGGYRWSSARAHLTGQDELGMLDMDWWRKEAPGNWEQMLRSENAEGSRALRECTHSGRPFGDDQYVEEMAERFGRCWTRGRPKKETAGDRARQKRDQLVLF